MKEWNFLVPDMSCAHCEKRIRGVLEGLPGSQDIKIDLAIKQVQLKCPQSLEEITSALGKIGYTVQVPG